MAVIFNSYPLTEQVHERITCALMKVWQRHIAGTESLIESSVQRMKFISKIPHIH
jgi:hypothetical protein